MLIKFKDHPAPAVVFQEARFGILAAIIAAFGRVIAELGTSMMLEGEEQILRKYD